MNDGEPGGARTRDHRIKSAKHATDTVSSAMDSATSIAPRASIAPDDELIGHRPGIGVQPVAKIPRTVVLVRDSPARWRILATTGPALPVMPSACRDCAIKCGYYRDNADDLAQQPANIQRDVRARWFCHKRRDHACAGINAPTAETSAA